MIKKGTIPLILGLLLLAAALSLAVYNIRDGIRAGDAARDAALALQLDQTELLPASKRRIYQPELFQQEYREPEYYTPDPTAQTPAETEPVPQIVPPMAVKREAGFDYIGVLTVPSLDLKLPIMATWDYDRLQFSPCVYSGNYFSNDLVICGHNYVTHFSPLRSVSLGAEVFLTTVDGYVYRYLVDNVETIAPANVQDMIHGDDWDLTLFTCHLGGQTRCAVRCVLTEQ